MGATTVPALFYFFSHCDAERIRYIIGTHGRAMMDPGKNKRRSYRSPSSHDNALDLPGNDRRCGGQRPPIAVAPELLEALDFLLKQTVDSDLEYGIELTEGEREAHENALAAIARTVK